MLSLTSQTQIIKVIACLSPVPLRSLIYFSFKNLINSKLAVLLSKVNVSPT